MPLTDFFRESDFTLGVFYPRHCITAVFASLSPAESAEQALRHAGFEADRVIVVSGRDVIEFDRDHTTVLSILMRAVSRFFKTEQSFNDVNLEHAHHGAGFLIVRCSDGNAKDRAWQVMKIHLTLVITDLGRSSISPGIPTQTDQAAYRHSGEAPSPRRAYSE